MVVLVTVGWLSMLKASLLAAGLMLLTRCCGATAARRSIDWQVLLAIAASFAIGDALENTGAAGGIANGMIQLAQAIPGFRWRWCTR